MIVAQEGEGIMDAGENEYAQPVPSQQAIVHTLVARGLNTQYGSLSKHCGSLPQEEFIALVTEAAKDWAEGCFP